ncbi:MAG TPA: riboflavin synthase [Solirubrobacteraceae bacterium]|nr:riboflavin synthase [Solirubrobacteraceae bacterium]
MFTGLIADLGTVLALDRGEEGARLRVGTPLAGELSAGDSVAVNGVCLTATEVRDGTFAADAMSETLRRTSLGALHEGARVNIELPLRASDRLGGHVVQGHVDATGTVRGLREEGFSRVLEIEAPAEVCRHLVEKGSVALDGVSLTVSALADDGFEVSLIPETLARTNLGALAAGDSVNIETDILAKHVARLLELGTPGARA